MTCRFPIIRRSARTAGLVCLALTALAPGAREEDGAQRAPLETVYRGIPHDALYDMHFHGGEGLAVGAFGLVLASEDAGASWRALKPAPAREALLGVTRAGDRRIIVGQEGLVLVSDDGRRWRRVASGTQARLLGVDLRGDLAVAVGAFGTLLRSVDGGERWQAVAVDWSQLGLEEGYEPHLYDVHVGGRGEVLVVGEFGLVLASSDGAQTWHRRHAGEASLFALHMRADGTGYAVGQKGTVLRTHDHGGRWESVAVPSAANLLNVWSSPFGEVVIVGIRVLLRSSDDGVSWRASADPAVKRSWFQALAVAERRSRIAANGRLIEEGVLVGGERATVARVTR